MNHDSDDTKKKLTSHNRATRNWHRNSKFNPKRIDFHQNPWSGKEQQRFMWNSEKKKTFKLSEVGQIIHAILNILSWTRCKILKKMHNHDIETPRSTTNMKWWEKENPRSPYLRPNKVQGRNRMLSSSLWDSRAATVNKFTTKLIRTKTHTGKPGSVLAKELSSRQGKQLPKTSGMYTREWC
jgi:hypothetical protein